MNLKHDLKMTAGLFRWGFFGLIFLAGTVHPSGLWGPLTGSFSGSFNNMRVFDDPNADNSFKIPSGVKQILVEVWSAGGAGGGGCNAGSIVLGGGGGGGGYAKALLNVQPGAVYPVAVGEGGSGQPGRRGWGFCDGVDGGNSGFGRLINITGGGGGLCGLNTAAGGSGGASSVIQNIYTASGAAGGSGGN